MSQTEIILDKRQDNSKTETELIINAEHIPKNYKDYRSATTNETTSNCLPMDATLQRSPFNVRNFLACMCFLTIIPSIIIYDLGSIAPKLFRL